MRSSYLLFATLRNFSELCTEKKEFKLPFNMETKENIAVLFDFDGVVVDTETQYSRFWHRIGADYLGRNDLEGLIKGQTLTHIYEMFFKGKEKEQREITQALNRFEEEMSYEFIPGFPGFMADLRKHGIRTAVVTSSNP